MVFLFVFLYLLVATAQIVILTYFDAKYNFSGDSSLVVLFSVFWPVTLPILSVLFIVCRIGLLVDELRQYFIENMK